MTKQRLLYIDIAKGIGILLVALAHNDLAGYAPLLYHWIYSFHMPLFFFLSGLFFKPEIGFIDLLRRRFDSLLKPYFFGIFLIYFGAIFFDKMGLPIAFGRLLKSLYANRRVIQMPLLGTSSRVNPCSSNASRMLSYKKAEVEKIFMILSSSCG